MDRPKFVRKEREHIAVLQQRLAYLKVDRPERRDEPDYIPGEAQALGWVLSVLDGTLEPLDVRMERIERRMRQYDTRLGEIAQSITDVVRMVRDEVRD